jgi:hypothetical protein
MLNGEIKRAPGLPPDTGTQMAWEDVDKRKQPNYTCTEKLTEIVLHSN